MVREGAGVGKPPNCTDFTAELGVSRRTVARDLDFLRDEERAPLEYDDARHGFRLTDETYALPPVSITRQTFIPLRTVLPCPQPCQRPCPPPMNPNVEC